MMTLRRRFHLIAIFCLLPGAGFLAQSRGESSPSGEAASSPPTETRTASDTLASSESNSPEPPAPPKPLTAEQQKQFNLGKNLYAAACASCHQLGGEGMAGLAPPLAQSEWVSGSVERLGRILLHGMQGPVTVKGTVWELQMPALAVFDDDQLAAILTYIRREWQHTADPVEPETIKKIREATGDRIDPWTEKELLAIE